MRNQWLHMSSPMRNLRLQIVDHLGLRLRVIRVSGLGALSRL